MLCRVGKHVDAARVLLDYGAYPDAWDDFKWRLSHFASIAGYLENVWLFLESGDKKRNTTRLSCVWHLNWDTLITERPRISYLIGHHSRWLLEWDVMTLHDCYWILAPE